MPAFSLAAIWSAIAFCTASIFAVVALVEASIFAVSVLSVAPILDNKSALVVPKSDATDSTALLRASSLDMPAFSLAAIWSAIFFSNSETAEVILVLSFVSVVLNADSKSFLEVPRSAATLLTASDKAWSRVIPAASLAVIWSLIRCSVSFNAGAVPPVIILSS